MKSKTTEAPFTLVCLECDAGLDIRSEEQAKAAGWTQIDYAPKLPMANYVGLCADCQEKYNNWPTSEEKTREE